VSFSYSERQIPELSILWQQDPTTWQKPSAEQYAPLARQLVALMGNDPAKPWTLVLDVDGINVPKSTGAWTIEKIGYLASALGKIANNVSFGFHPNGEKVVEWWVPKTSPDQSPAAAQTSMVEFMESTNDHIRDLSNQLKLKLPLFDLFIGEGNGIQRNTSTFTHIRDELTDKVTGDVTLWSTGNYYNGVAVTPEGKKETPFNPAQDHPDNGTFLQIYDFVNKKGGELNPLVGKNTDPDNKLLGTQIFDAVTIPTNNHLHPDTLKYVDRAVHAFNGSGKNDAAKGLNDAPVFGGKGQVGVTPGKGWTLETFGPVMSDYAKGVKNASATNTMPQMSVWYINNLLDYLIPSKESYQYLDAVYAYSGDGKPHKNLFNRYQHNSIIETEKKSNLRLELKFDSAFKNGIGLYPLLDQTGRIVSSDGNIYHPLDSGYLAKAKELATLSNHWIDADETGKNRKIAKFNLHKNTQYAVIADSDIDSDGGLYSSLSLSNESAENRIAVSEKHPQRILGFEDTVHRFSALDSNLGLEETPDFSDIQMKILNPKQISFSSESVLKQSTFGSQSLAPDLNSVWMNGLALDNGSAYQFAELVVGNPSNIDIDLVIDAQPPGDQTTSPVPGSHLAKGFTASNTFPQYLKFLNEIDHYVNLLSKGKIPKWNGEIIYHPQTEDGDEYRNWAGFSGTLPVAPKSFKLPGNNQSSQDEGSYDVYVDWMGAFNLYMSAYGQKKFKELLFETEGSYWYHKEDQLFSDIRTSTNKYPNQSLFPSANVPAFHDLKFSSTIAGTKPWQSYGADANWLQAYDYAGDSSYKPIWNGTTDELNPASNTPKQAAKKYADFYAVPALDDAVKRVNNIKKMVTPLPVAADPDQGIKAVIPTEFDPGSRFTFSYAGQTANLNNDGPVFRKQTKTGKKSQNVIWQWDKDQFAGFVDEFRSQVPAALNQTAAKGGETGNFLGSRDHLNLSVWDSSNALDAWFGVPNHPILESITPSKDYANNGLVDQSSIYKLADSAEKITVSHGGNILSSKTSKYWDLIAAKQSKSGYQLLAKGSSRKSGKYAIWSADSSGAVVKKNPWILQSKAIRRGWENKFNVDINRNGVLSAHGNRKALWGDFLSNNLPATSDVKSIYGRAGDDQLTGSLSSETLFGGLGDDVLDGLGGEDSLLGGEGADTFVLNKTGIATILDYELGVDQIKFGSAMDIEVVDQGAKTKIYGDGQLLAKLKGVSGELQHLEVDSGGLTI